MPRRTWSWVVRSITTLFIAMALVFSGGAPALAATDWNPPVLTINDPAGTSQDWYMWAVDGESYYSYDSLGNSVIPPGQQISSGGALNLTVYVVHYLDGEIRPVPIAFTNAAGARAPNSVTLHTDQMVCAKFSTQLTWLPVTFNETADGSGLTTATPGVMFTNEYETSTMEVNSYSHPSSYVLADGTSLVLNDYNQTWQGLQPGWYTVFPYSRDSSAGLQVLESSQSQKLWIPPCGGALPPAGHVPPGVVVPTPPNPGGVTVRATGRLKLLRAVDKVKAKGINRKVNVRSRFRLKANGKVVKVFVAPAGKVEIRKIKAKARTRYVLQVRKVVNGKTRYVRVARLVVKG